MARPPRGKRTNYYDDGTHAVASKNPTNRPSLRSPADPTGSRATRTGPEGSRPDVPSTPESGLRHWLTSCSATTSEPETSPAPTRHCRPRRRGGPPTCEPNESFVPTPQRSRSGFHPPTADEQPLDAVPVRTPMTPRSMNTNEKSNRNDVLAETQLQRRNDVLAPSHLPDRNDVPTVTTERCPGGSHLGSATPAATRKGRRGIHSSPSGRPLDRSAAATHSGRLAEPMSALLIRC